MRAYFTSFIVTFLFFFFSSSYAININVHSTSKVSGLGFTVNGKNHGGMGNTYSAKDMPEGKYSFGIRVGGAISGKDIPCNSSDGQKYVILKKDTNAILQYSGKSCTLKIS
ncbi:MAG: hypothetical protein JO131_02670 [Gammaproteobacteria bacterium]|nr:hypothetical protein [Gammaproteobacteria bacterium]